MLQTGQNALAVRFEAQARAFEREPFPALEVRKDRLNRLLALTEKHEAEICAAIDGDFCGRAQQETRLAELFVVRAGIRHAIRHLRGWMRERRLATSLPFLPGRNRLLAQPLGVVGIVSPWNYPFQLAIAPATAALAAGNRVLIKPSELTPKFSDLLARLVEEHFSPDEMSVVVGDAEAGKAFVSMPFDHLLFTGSTAVGRQVALAAAANLTPVTLELGGKSPAIFDPSCDLDAAVASVAYGKLLNAGQTCIAPDYLMVPRGQGATVAAKLAAAMARLYPSLRNNPDYTAIISERHHKRLGDMVAEARESGAEVVEVNPAREELGVTDRKMSPVLVRNAGETLRLMREEIFGPVLPIVEYGTLEQAIDHVNRAERPLALYWFGSDSANRRRMMRETIAGGVTVNDCMMHLVQERQPFGGVGESGMGAYHGEWGFRTFSKEKPIFVQSRLSAGGLLRPPYGRRFEWLFRLLNLIT
ncbi:MULTISPECIES: coniferyl aldehyde dehydrogenase [unclassified Mesorhizobium]|uniref:coniferyl aldehyde dehydrogenase n=1 Tax=unclassified Mesorhizobium TaxID=325217 RepID=UPI000F753B25|nr:MULTISPECIES: coniferyl aldehyde dehydrogenase [unclassified Mesorhizobium]TGT64008.1 coniferyl aldehyde dehydrogenase [Mesorhizobium sp. M00.F.Ca.ET.170.01.1.1]AZO11133.1 coniferyl aldehyde dehydrogenase [Mesorhizobium sp. M3A.F.Ca.ET.080.04.2.1]RWB76480.1 MAG: coniferyl aldehyde dehydrogenase [Mesorhizobium sp.]RWB92346.1 MAG: coniferyl aldehyde dehydrogenase [Mesorhizobium sp.]TGS70518.1 coniferyl aldehyde dehydrogenase [Mesorhizobium sp. M3A.F.Ca.ET.201.01.1.1]